MQVHLTINLLIFHFEVYVTIESLVIIAGFLFALFYDEHRTLVDQVYYWSFTDELYREICLHLKERVASLYLELLEVFESIGSAWEDLVFPRYTLADWKKWIWTIVFQ